MPHPVLDARAGARTLIHAGYLQFCMKNCKTERLIHDMTKRDEPCLAFTLESRGSAAEAQC